MSDQNYIDEIAHLWNIVKDSFKDTDGESLSETAINLWFDPIQVVSYRSANETGEMDILTLGINSPFKYQHIKEKFLEKINKEFNRVLGFDIHVELIKLGDEAKSTHESPSFNAPTLTSDHKSNDEPAIPNYNFEYTFENFIVGSTNKFAHAACYAVANNPVNHYNPLFIYGNSGLGKTHLLCAIVNRLKQNNPNVRIIYSKCEDFTNQMISCLANKTMEDFRDKYRKCDVLLIDDIQFIAGKTSTQEEFFNTFNALFEERKQIVFTSDRPPKDINPLEERLRSRFEQGLLADIEPPDLELRIAIIKKKAEQVNITLSNEVMTYLGENLRSNVRQIEGTIKKLAAINFISGIPISMEVARKCITDIYGGTEPINVTVDKIFSSIYRKYNVTKEELTGKKRNKEIANSRHVAIYLIREMTEMSYPNIGKIFDRDHTTVMSSINSVVHKINSSPDFASEISNLKKEISER